LDEWFPGRWIDRGGPINLPSSIPDLTPTDFFFWGCIKDLVHSEKVYLLPICAEGLQRNSLWCLWICCPGCGVKWNFVSTSVRPSVVLTLNCTKL
jgi:hypothetical protein